MDGALVQDCGVKREMTNCDECVGRGDSLKTFLEYMELDNGLGDADTEEIQESGDLISSQPVDRKRGPIEATFKNC